MIIDELLVVLGIKADDSGARRFADSLENVSTEAQNTERSMIGAYEATDGFVSAIEGFMGVLGFFTGVLGGAWAFFHSTIADIETLIEEEKLLTKVTKDQLEQSKKYNDSVEQLGKRYQSLKVELAFGFLPTMQRMIDAVDGFLASNKDLIVNGITTLLNVMSKTVGIFVNFFRFIDLLIERTVGWKFALGVLAAALLWVNRAMLLTFVTNPIFWVVAAIGVLLLLIDDFMTYLDGGESQFGDFWGSMLEWIDIIKPALQSVWDLLVMGMSYLIEFGAFVAKYLGGAFTDAVEVVTAVLAFLVGLFTGNTELMSAAWSGMIENLLSMFQNLAMLFDPLAQKLLEIMSSVWDAIVNYISTKISEIISAISGFISSIGSALSGVFDIITAPFAQAFDWIVNKFSSLGGLISGAVSGAKNLVGAGGAAAVSNNNINSGGNMTVNAPISVTSNNPIAAGKAVQSGLGSTMNTAKRNMGGTPKA
ncbi:MAG: hypothetical protein RSE38_05150 [Acinetobacter sp.]